MTFIMAIYNFLIGPSGALVLGLLFMLSEVLALIPGIQSNSIFQLIQNGLKSLWAKLFPGKPLPGQPQA